MAGFTYSSLKTAIQDYVDTSETTFVNNLNIIIEQAEERILKGVWLDNSYNHRDWFFGNSAEIPRWVGYSIGYKLVKDFMQINTTKKPSNLFNESANSFKQ
jgi:uncharacterized protein YjaZ